ncbi:putative exported protein [invertebrate metagenome]|uniref:Murein endopeptidase K n=1 Tax=invertebrate metagenome TaxID=1711999 RepID=A0A484H5L4_9ZZZZ
MNEERGRNITRRSLVLLGGSSLLAMMLHPVSAAVHFQTERALSLDVLPTGEKLKRVYWAEGHYIPQALREIHYLLRDYRAGEVKTIDVKLLDLLHEIRALIGSRSPFEVVSGYRSQQTNRWLQRTNPSVARHSYHTQGMAVDFRLPDCDLVKLKAVALKLGRGGVGYYPHTAFLHVDVGPRRQW